MIDSISWIDLKWNAISRTMSIAEVDDWFGWCSAIDTLWEGS